MRVISSTALHQYLQRYVVGDATLLDRPSREIEIGLRGGGKADLDLPESHVEQQVEHARFAVVTHRVDQRLVAVAKVDRAPDGACSMRFDGQVRSVRPTG